MFVEGVTDGINGTSRGLPADVVEESERWIY